jgi:hypothetical protein
MAAFLQCLKEAFADPGEALKIQWIGITGNVITINHPVKRTPAKKLQISKKLLAMLNSQPKANEKIFPTTYEVMENCYLKTRKRVAEIQKNPRLLSIEMRAFRHWGGTMFSHTTPTATSSPSKNSSDTNALKTP